MTPETLKALRDSIAHWERMRDEPRECEARDEEPDCDSCSLCAKFYGSRDKDNRCRGCPVWERTRNTDCKGSPFFDAREAWYWLFYSIRTGHTHARECEAAWEAAAQREIDFLKSLLPEKTNANPSPKNA